MIDDDPFDDEGYQPIRIPKAEMKELREYFEMTDTEIFEKATNILFDILQAEKIGWKFGFMKLRTQEGRQVYDTRYTPNILPLGISELANPNTRINHESFESLRQEDEE